MKNKVAFYIMNSKGFYVLSKFIQEFGSDKIEYVISNEDKNIKKDYFFEIEELALKNNILFFNKNNDSLDEIEKNFKGYKFAIGWRWIINNSKNLIVFHDSLLPKYRGFSPLVNALINGEKEVGVTALFANKEYDKGDIILQKSIKINYPIKIYNLIKKIEPIYFELVKNIYLKIISNKYLLGRKQKDIEATYSIWLDKEDYFIDWEWDAKKIKRFIDAVGYPYDNAKAYLENIIVHFIEVEICKDVFIENRERHLGKIVFFKEGYPVIICKKGLLKLIDVRDDKNNNIIRKIKFRSRFK